ncbi:MAG: carbohydrate ABC transporter permease [Candidatus Neomarinimicrobiota bacterium]|nr:carbohydrate ABC transporter permease [Candidatus Neomarinimicrobiota bacterium]RKY47113.1 MAG: carbohydrate ABC transporter permease [Candidatus Neomarinimicrobiota bacterium]RKY53702.1 MAG: carbohydrate ABC transporter permease [Candidatus Neomarinimicrobiota bacterium]HDN58641.1 carbohydrate ABC transporter permease [Candidatus Neomarinimicrobiota bacterium]
MKKFVVYLVLIVGGVIFFYPFLWMIMATFRSEIDIGYPGLFVKSLTLHNYEIVFKRIPILRALFNSLFVSLSVTASVIFFGSVVGYALSRLKFKIKGLILGVILFTMVIPFQITLIPMYILMVKFGWVDTYLALIVPGMISSFGILLFRQFFLDIPQDLIDAARIDGCNDFQILFKIFLPLSKPVMITVGIFSFMATWNDVLWPMLVIRTRELMTMPQLVTLFSIGGEAEGQLGPQLAATTLLALPIVVAYAFFQRYFIESMATTGLKG